MKKWEESMNRMHDLVDEALKRMNELVDKSNSRHTEYIKHKEEIAKGDFSNYDVTK